MAEPVWVRHDVVLAIHRLQLAEHGGSDGVRDDGLLDSALARAKYRYAYTDPRPDLATLAASYAYGLSSNHPFVDGNKRTSLVVCRTFLALNDCRFEAPQAELYESFLSLARGDLGEDQLAAWIRRHLNPSPSPEDHHS